ncbi:MAG: preprotein translocase subunit SecY [Actinobacteria bacterium]|nr:preprotein translocase subunit SecY [Actinomycetota bacterium]
MLRTFRNIYKVVDLRRKILFTFVIILLYRLGSSIPSPGVNTSALTKLVEEGGILGFLNFFSGGALSHLAVFGLGIMPYITSAIIMEMLVAVIPKLKEWQEEGESGRRKITQVTRYLTLGLALMQSIGLVWQFSRARDIGGETVRIIEFTWMKGIVIVLALTAGMALLMWFGELITERGIGNGMSILIFTSIIARVPYEFKTMITQTELRYGNVAYGYIISVVMSLAVIVAVIYLDQGERRIPVQYAKQIRGRRMTMGGSTYLPLKINTSGVIPIIFASSIIFFPTMLSQFIPALQGVATHLTQGWLYFVVYTFLIIFFAYFYTYIVFDPFTQAEHLKKYGAFVPGIRPGTPTATYFGKVINRITLPGSMALAAIALLPAVMFYFFGTREIPFGGAAIMIIVGVALETMKQIEAQLQMRHYEGFLR